jgi:hypothetical protein
MRPNKHKIDMHMEKVSTSEIRVRSIEVNHEQLQNIKQQIGKQIGDYKLLKLYEVDS